jgi:hypothetical protein
MSVEAATTAVVDAVVKGVADTSIDMMPEMVMLHTAVQVLVIIITVGMFLFFLYQFIMGKAAWEILFVCFIEVLVYLSAALIPDGYEPVFGHANSPMIRFISWQTTCPFLIKVMLTVVNPHAQYNKEASSTSNKLIAADLLMNACGMFGCIYENIGIKLALFAVGCMIAMYIVNHIYVQYEMCQGSLDQPIARRGLLFLMFFSWALFPVLFLMNPDHFELMSWGTSAVTHAIGDLLAKNLFGLWAWVIMTRTGKAAKKKEEKEKAVLAEALAEEVKMSVLREKSRNSQYGGSRNGSQYGSDYGDEPHKYDNRRSEQGQPRSNQPLFHDNNMDNNNMGNNNMMNNNMMNNNMNNNMANNSNMDAMTKAISQVLAARNIDPASPEGRQLLSKVVSDSSMNN